MFTEVLFIAFVRASLFSINAFFHAIYECIVNKYTLCALDHAHRRIHFHSVKQTAAVSFSPIPSRSPIFCKHFVTKYCVNGFYHIGTMPCMQVLHFMQLIIEYIPSAGWKESKCNNNIYREQNLLWRSFFSHSVGK